MAIERKYSDFDFEHLTEMYLKHSWLREQVNFVGFEDLWFDYEKNEEKIIIKKLVDNFKYLDQESAELKVKDHLSQLIIDKNLKWNNTIFIGFKKNKFADGSAIFLNFIKPILNEINSSWIEENLFSYLYDGIERIKKGGFKDVGIDLENVVLIDDFIGTGGTAIKINKLVKEAIEKQSKIINLYMFSMASMEEGRELIEKSHIEFRSCFILKKGTELAFSKSERDKAKESIRKLERILHEGSDKMKLKDFTLGYGESEALYSWNRFNIPNNNYPIFWWHRYLGDGKRKTMFNRNQ